MPLIKRIALSLQQGGIAHPKRQAEELLCDLLECSRADLYSGKFNTLTQKQQQMAAAWVERRIGGEPLAYISGKLDFYGCEIHVSPSVLIPRQETEVLVDKIAARLKGRDLRGQVLWDICCGSGCIGIALKKSFPELSVVLSDCSQDAIEQARYNARINEVEVEFYVGDLFVPFAGKKAHYFVCNPPYISEAEYGTLDKAVKAYEPRLALVGGETGLEIYERIAKELPLHLYPGGEGWMEIGYDQGTAVQSLFEGVPWKMSKVENDWAGHSRFFWLLT